MAKVKLGEWEPVLALGDFDLDILYTALIPAGNTAFEAPNLTTRANEDSCNSNNVPEAGRRIDHGLQAPYYGYKAKR